MSSLRTIRTYFSFLNAASGYSKRVNKACSKTHFKTYHSFQDAIIACNEDSTCPAIENENCNDNKYVLCVVRDYLQDWSFHLKDYNGDCVHVRGKCFLNIKTLPFCFYYNI